MKYSTLLLAGILLVSVLTILSPAVTSFAATGTPNLGVISTTYPYKFTTAGTNVSVPAGSSQAFGEDSHPATSPIGLFAINFTGVIFQGSVFFLYVCPTTVSNCGLAQLVSSDKNYSGPFQVSTLQLTHSSGGMGPLHGWVNVTISNPLLPGGSAVFSLGNDTVVGPVPVGVAGGTYYVKAFDGQTTAVAVTKSELVILPGITITPTSGPAGQTVIVTGSAFTANNKANVSVSTTFNSLNMPTGTKFISVNVTTGSIGNFSYSFSAPDLNLQSGTGTFVVTSEDYGTSTWVFPQTYNELARAVTLIYFQPSGYKTYTPPSNASAYIPGFVMEPIIIVGSNFNPSGSITLTFNGTSVTPTFTTPLNVTTGAFNATFLVPVAPHGVATVLIHDASAVYAFKVGVLPTLLAPTYVTPGGSITLTGYSFTALSTANITWIGLGVGNKNVTLLFKNVPVSGSGNFSVTGTVPSPVYGGRHVINVTDSAGVPGFATTNVTATTTLSPTTAALGTEVVVSSQGLPAGTETFTVTSENVSGTYSAPTFATSSTSVTTGSASAGSISAVYDNTLTAYSSLSSSNYGGLTVQLIAAGVPEMHFIQLYAGIPPSLLSTSPLNVTGSTLEGAAIEAQLQTVLSNEQSLATSLSSLSSAVASNANALSTLQTSVNKVDSDVQSVGSSVSSLSTTVSNGFSSTSSSLSSIQNTLGTLATSSGLQSVTSTLNNVSTFLYVAIALAAIVLILEIVILVRKR